MFIFGVIAGAAPVVQPLALDEALIMRIGTDDMEAFERFYILTEKPLFAYILSLVRNRQDAEDVLHDTYIKIRAAAHLYEPMGKPMAWVFTIARNFGLMKLRQNKRDTAEPIETLEERLALPSMMDNDDRFVLATLLDTLEESERSIILLHAVSGYRHREIARDLGIPLSTVLSKYSRGLKKLRRKLERREGE